MKLNFFIILLVLVVFSTSHAAEKVIPNWGKTNYMHASTDPKEEIKAYKEIARYLIKLGKYKDFTSADIDARGRVNNFKELGVYSNDPNMKNASIYKRKIHALIYAHNLHDVIINNKGYLPNIKE